MTITALTIFAFAILVAAASPGPAIAALLARVIGRGTAGVPAFIGGIVLGDIIWLAIAVLGLSFVANSFEMIFAVIKYAGAAYLLFIAYRLWTAPAKPVDVDAAGNVDGKPRRSFFGELLLTLGNPKTIAFYLALTPTLIDVSRIDLVSYAELAGIIAVVLVFVLGGYALAAARARKLFRSPRAMKLLNRIGGGVMAGAAAAIATRQA
ncbi:threonine/homoserine/homoserine lactone efflux protein [Afipia massiliensis]|uniref:Threonine/homoserine/homoserine lactone efflux protein n=1 Tax=Afipia massiliensis TaxID=211460 RepID=A0A840N255_9BRAD|nr:LysE family translocator [Afipia massiliensis]MBB5053002.1 threonine/homoserine/homoserine lactone efflux protein [Afipia massiliensis]